MKARRFLLTIAYSGIALVAMSQTVIVNGNIRPRAEYRDGYGSPIEATKDPSGFVLQRTRIGVDYKQPSFQAKFTLQDARTFGETSISSQSTSGQSTLGVYEAWIRLPLFSDISIKMGRQTLSYDDNRLFSDSNWSNTGSAHDLLLCAYERQGYLFHLGLAYNNNTSELSESYYKPAMKYRYLGYMRFEKSINPIISLSAMVVDEGVQNLVNGSYGTKCSMYHAYTWGGNLKWESPLLSALVTAYMQSGTTTGGLHLNNLLLAANASYNICPKVRIKAGCDYFSGASQREANEYASFKKLYGTEHAFNGSMDYWSVLPYQGLINYYGGLSLKFHKQTEVEGLFHLFRTESEVILDKSRMGKSLGAEIDLSISYKLNKWTNLKGGWSCYFTTSNTFVAKGMLHGDYRFPQWAFVMLSVSPEYLFQLAEKL